jgi:divinyl chlorophyllide a 8-vinyl-reductase
MRILLLGATGTIGQATAKALLADGHDVICPVRARAGSANHSTIDRIRKSLPGVDLRFSDACSVLERSLSLRQGGRIDAIVSCLASRTGTPHDAWEVDYRMHAEILNAAKSADIQHVILLSAICVQKPLLGFQQAKLAFEKELISSGIRYTIVRPTAFFKSLSGQVERLQRGKPFLVFGDGRLTACKPISDHDLAQFIASCLTDIDKHNRLLPIGGPGAAITPIEQGDYLFKRMGKKPRIRHIPIGVIDAIIATLRAGGRFLPALADKAELARIGRYYATESMLVWNATLMKYDAEATPSYGTQTLFDYYDRLLSGEERVELGEHAVF